MLTYTSQYVRQLWTCTCCNNRLNYWQLGTHISFALSCSRPPPGAHIRGMRSYLELGNTVTSGLLVPCSCRSSETNKTASFTHCDSAELGGRNISHWLPPGPTYFPTSYPPFSLPHHAYPYPYTNCPYRHNSQRHNRGKGQRSRINSISTRNI